MSNELTQNNRGTLKSMLSSDAMKQQFAAALPKHLTPDRFVRVAITALTRTPKLADCTQESFFKCLLDLSAVGLEPDGRKAHLIPRGKECTLTIDYKGLVELVRRDKDVVDVQCYTIRENDTALWTNGELKHSYDPLKPRGEVRATYTRITWANGHVSVGEPFTREEAEAIKRRSPSGNSGPWVTDFVEMWKKSAVRRDSKMWPLSSEVQESIAKMDNHEFGDMRNVTQSVNTNPPASNPFKEQPATPEQPAIETPAFDLDAAQDADWGGEGEK